MMSETKVGGCIGEFAGAVAFPSDEKDGVELFYDNGIDELFGVVEILCDPSATELVERVSMDSKV